LHQTHNSSLPLSMTVTAPWFLLILAAQALGAAALCALESSSCEADSTSPRLSPETCLFQKSQAYAASTLALPPPPTNPVPLYAGASCAEEAVHLGTSFSSVQACAEAAGADPACGDAIQYPVNDLWSKWGCRCCIPGANHGVANSNWNVYPIYYTVLLHAETSCATQAVFLGTTFSNVESCATAARADPACGDAIMYPINSLWSKWGCRCCSPDDNHGNQHPSWSVYSIYGGPADAQYQRRRRTSAWPDEDAEACSQSTKQKSMYADFTWSPSLDEEPTTNVSMSVLWQDFVRAPWRSDRGGVYAAWVFKTGTGSQAPAGYFGAQIKRDSGFIFSVWDGNRKEGGGHGVPVPSDKLAWPLDTTHCERNCQDCGLEALRPLKERGLTTGTKCWVSHPGMSSLGRFDLRMERLEETYTINTGNYGGMGEGHNEIGEYDRDVTGSVWRVLAADAQTGMIIEVGRLLFEGGPSIVRLTTFDEMLGCNKCNDQYHMDTRYGPFLHDRLESTQAPIQCSVTAVSGSSCRLLKSAGNASASSVTFEGGPGAGEPMSFDPTTETDVW